MHKVLILGAGKIGALISGLLAESGRGVPLVTGFSDRWGSFPRGQGKVVWFELDDV